jgi:hypothetical protein
MSEKGPARPETRPERSGEQKPKPAVKQSTIQKLGGTAIKGANK